MLYKKHIKKSILKKHIKKQDKIPEEQLSDVKIGKSTWRRIQSNGSKDDLRSWKNNRGIDWEEQEIFSKELENLNNKIDNTITEMKNTLEVIVEQMRMNG